MIFIASVRPIPSDAASAAAPKRSKIQQATALIPQGGSVVPLTNKPVTESAVHFGQPTSAEYVVPRIKSTPMEYVVLQEKRISEEYVVHPDGMTEGVFVVQIRLLRGDVSVQLDMGIVGGRVVRGFASYSSTREMLQYV